METQRTITIFSGPVTAVVIVLLLAGNIFFYLRSGLTIHHRCPCRNMMSNQQQFHRHPLTRMTGPFLNLRKIPYWFWPPRTQSMRTRHGISYIKTSTGFIRMRMCRKICWIKLSRIQNSRIYYIPIYYSPIHRYKIPGYNISRYIISRHTDTKYRDTKSPDTAIHCILVQNSRIVYLQIQNSCP